MTKGPRLLCLPLLCAACGTGNTAMNMPPPPEKKPEAVQLLAGANLHVLGVWTRDWLIATQGDAFPQEKQPWPALYRVKTDGSGKDLLATEAYHVLFKREAPGQSPVLTYLTPTTPGVQTLKSTGHLWVCRPGQPPVEIMPPDPPLVWQPALLSPDSGYLVSYGQIDDPDRFGIQLTDLQSGTTLRLGTSLAVAVPRWFGFQGTGPHYVGLSYLDDNGPFAVFKLTGATTSTTPVVLSDRMAGLLPDGRALLEGAQLRAAVLADNGTVTPLADGPVSPFSAFIAMGTPYFIRMVTGQSLGPLLRVPLSGTPQTLLPAIDSVWLLSGGEGIAYLTDRTDKDGRDLIALDLKSGTSTKLSDQGIRSYRPMSGDGILWGMTDAPGVWFWTPGKKQPLALGADVKNALLVAGGRFVTLVVPTPAAAPPPSVAQPPGPGLPVYGAIPDLPQGMLRLIDGNGTGNPIATLTDRADLRFDSLEPEPDGTVLFYSVLGMQGGIWRYPLL